MYRGLSRACWMKIFKVYISCPNGAALWPATPLPAGSSPVPSPRAHTLPAPGQAPGWRIEGNTSLALVTLPARASAGLGLCRVLETVLDKTRFRQDTNNPGDEAKRWRKFSKLKPRVCGLNRASRHTGNPSPQTPPMLPRGNSIACLPTGCQGCAVCHFILTEEDSTHSGIILQLFWKEKLQRPSRSSRFSLLLIPYPDIQPSPAHIQISEKTTP